MSGNWTQVSLIRTQRWQL